jgi:hypothetical protein
MPEEGPTRRGTSLDRAASVAQPGAPGGQHAVRWARLRAVTGHPVARHLALLIAYLAAGVAVTWPRATYLAAGRLPDIRDQASYVWDFWWVARQVTHLADPWSTGYMAAPVGVQLGFHALMPLPAVLLLPVTLAFGPSASANLLSIALPGLMCYAMYRLARLWLRSQTAAIAAGALFGLSTMLTWQSWYLLNIAAGALFLPIALEAAVRLRRRPGRRQAVILGLVVAACVLTDQETAVLMVILVALTLLPWLLSRPTAANLGITALAALVAVVVASPQLVAMLQQVRSGGATIPMRPLVRAYVTYVGRLPAILGPSPRATVAFGLPSLGGDYQHYGGGADGITTFGLVLTVLAVLGVMVSWRRRNAWLLALLWIGSAVLALGPVLWIGTTKYVPFAETWYHQRVSLLMPYTWFVRLPGLSSFREANRLGLLGMVPAALLAGAAVEWLRQHARLVMIGVLAAGILEAGWSGDHGLPSMPTALPALDRPIAADHSRSIVVDVPFGLRGGVPAWGATFVPEALVLATADGHPRAIAYASREPTPTINGIAAHPFYARLVAAQGRVRSSPAELAAARQDARRMDIGWVLVWRSKPTVIWFLRRTGFRFDYAADGVRVYRPAGPGRGG